jgi:hypothetical protein
MRMTMNEAGGKRDCEIRFSIWESSVVDDVLDRMWNSDDE